VPERAFELQVNDFERLRKKSVYESLQFRQKGATERATVATIFHFVWPADRD
jgi:hypothetical protein